MMKINHSLLEKNKIESFKVMIINIFLKIEIKCQENQICDYQKFHHPNQEGTVLLILDDLQNQKYRIE